MEPASIRYKNPGAMWGNALARKWGAEAKAVVLNDGKGQGNNIAVFPTYVQGICAQMDLWRTSKNYKNKRFADAIAIWSGHNSVEQYIAFVVKRAPGMTRDTVMDDAFWRGPLAIPFLKAQAGHEAGKVYPAPDADWIEAQKRVLSGTPVVTVKKAVAVVAVTATATAAHHAGVVAHTHVWAWDVPHCLLIVLALSGLLWASYEVRKWLKNYSLTSSASSQPVSSSLPSVAPLSSVPSGATEPSTSTTTQSPSVLAPTATVTEEKVDG